LLNLDRGNAASTRLMILSPVLFPTADAVGYKDVAPTVLTRITQHVVYSHMLRPIVMLVLCCSCSTILGVKSPPIHKIQGKSTPTELKEVFDDAWSTVDTFNPRVWVIEDVKAFGRSGTVRIFRDPAIGFVTWETPLSASEEIFNDVRLEIYARIVEVYGKPMIGYPGSAIWKIGRGTLEFNNTRPAKSLDIMWIPPFEE
jgi:hypothetical protein